MASEQEKRASTGAEEEQCMPRHPLHSLLHAFGAIHAPPLFSAGRLSLRHDIIAKGHGCTIAVESKEGAFAEFCIRRGLFEMKIVCVAF